MKGMLYPKLAFMAMQKNRRLYLPYFLTCIGMVAMHYIVTFLYYDQILLSMRGGRTLRLVMGFGSGVIAVFACIFLFYSNSFLMRRRKKEFGLYHILGMGKRHLGWILFWESLILGGFSLLIGLLISIVLSKLAELGMVHIMQENVYYTLYVSPEAVLLCAGVFIGIFFLLFLNALRQVRFSRTMDLLRSDTVGEKPPKANLFLGIAGLLLLAGAYCLAVTIEKPLAAMGYFFLAVIMVIIGTYLLMIAGSVTFCRILQRNKKYYYRPNHFVSVSSMAYRMKRNGAGLASICILSTMVLVMLSTTSCLYFGAEDSIRAMYPKAFYMTFRMEDADVMSDDSLVADLRDVIAEQVAITGGAFESASDWRAVQFYGVQKQGRILLDSESMEIDQQDKDSRLYRMMFVPLADYCRKTGTEQILEDGEALLFTTADDSDMPSTVTFDGDVVFRIAGKADGFAGEVRAQETPVMLFVVPDVDAATEYLNFELNHSLFYEWHLSFDTGLDREGDLEVGDCLGHTLAEKTSDRAYLMYTMESREEVRVNFYSTYGGLFYLGIILSIVFLFAAVLIVYYKQISEGYEDHAKFDMMQKIGMTKREIRKSINSQLLTVFFLPLLLAAVHLAFAFPMIRRILTLFYLNNLLLFAGTTIISFLVFSLLYVLVYRMTSNAYYRIVSAALRATE